MKLPGLGTTTLMLSVMSGAMAAAQLPSVTVHDDDITMRGCVTKPDASVPNMDRTLAWSRGDIMLAAAELPAAATGSRVFYWIDDDDLGEHVGERVEVKGELDDFEKGEVEIDVEGDFTNIELELDGDTEHARVPTAWLGHAAPDEDAEFDIIARRVDVKDIRVLGRCGIR